MWLEGNGDDLILIILLSFDYFVRFLLFSIGLFYNIIIIMIFYLLCLIRFYLGFVIR